MMKVAVGMIGRACPRWEATGEAMRATLSMAFAMQVIRKTHPPRTTRGPYV